MNDNVENENPEQPSRRKFLGNAGRFAAVTPAAVTVLLSTSLEAGARSIGASSHGGGKGRGRGHGRGGRFR